MRPTKSGLKIRRSSARARPVADAPSGHMVRGTVRNRSPPRRADHGTVVGLRTVG